MLRTLAAAGAVAAALSVGALAYAQSEHGSARGMVALALHQPPAELHISLRRAADGRMSWTIARPRLIETLVGFVAAPEPGERPVFAMENGAARIAALASRLAAASSSAPRFASDPD